jgi:phospholipase A2
LSNTRPIKAESSISKPVPQRNASIVVEPTKRTSHTKSTPSSGDYRANEPDKHFSGQQAPPPQTKVAEDERNKSDINAWNKFTSSIASIKWATIPDKISDLVVPDWFKLFPGFMNKFQNELSMAPGSLAEEIWREANDPEINPEIMWDASVRISDDLCQEEAAFLKSRKSHTRRALAAYLGIPESKIHPDDVPTIAMCGSGGGLRALVAGSGSYIASREAGLFDCITYTAGVSGSCWLQTLYFSLADQSHSHIIRHLKNRLGVHLAYPPAAFSLINSAPTNKFLLTGLVEKLKGTPDADFGIVDIYGMLLAGRLLVPKGELGVDLEHLKLSNQRQFIDQGESPLPIYTAVRHEIPVTAAEGMTAEQVKETARNEAWFQWFE